MKCYVVFVPADSSLDAKAIKETFSENLEFFERVWFVASDAHEDADDVRKALSIGSGRSGLVAPLSHAAGFANTEVVDQLIDWRDS